MTMRRVVPLVVVVLVSGGLTVYSIQLLRNNARPPVASQATLMIEAMGRAPTQTAQQTKALPGARKTRNGALNLPAGAMTVRVNDQYGLLRYVRLKQRVDLTIPAGHGKPETIIRNLAVIAKGMVREKDESGKRVDRHTLTFVVKPEEKKLWEDAKERGPMTFRLAGETVLMEPLPTLRVR